MTFVTEARKNLMTGRLTGYQVEVSHQPTMEAKTTQLSIRLIVALFSTLPPPIILLEWSITILIPVRILWNSDLGLLTIRCNMRKKTIH